jgi:hypothetical protein
MAPSHIGQIRSESRPEQMIIQSGMNVYVFSIDRVCGLYECLLCCSYTSYESEGDRRTWVPD